MSDNVRQNKPRTFAPCPEAGFDVETIELRPVLDLLERCSAWIHDDRRWHHEGLGPMTPAEIEEDLRALLREHGRLKP